MRAPLDSGNTEPSIEKQLLGQRRSFRAGVPIGQHQTWVRRGRKLVVAGAATVTLLSSLSPAASADPFGAPDNTGSGTSTNSSYENRSGGGTSSNFGGNSDSDNDKRDAKIAADKAARDEAERDAAAEQVVETAPLESMDQWLDRVNQSREVTDTVPPPSDSDNGDSGENELDQKTRSVNGPDVASAVLDFFIPVAAAGDLPPDVPAVDVEDSPGIQIEIDGHFETVGNVTRYFSPDDQLESTDILTSTPGVDVVDSYKANGELDYSTIERFDAAGNRTSFEWVDPSESDGTSNTLPSDSAAASNSVADTGTSTGKVSLEPQAPREMDDASQAIIAQTQPHVSVIFASEQFAGARVQAKAGGLEARASVGANHVNLEVHTGGGLHIEKDRDATPYAIGTVSGSAKIISALVQVEGTIKDDNPETVTYVGDLVHSTDEGFEEGNSFRGEGVGSFNSLNNVGQVDIGGASIKDRWIGSDSTTNETVEVTGSYTNLNDRTDPTDNSTITIDSATEIERYTVSIGRGTGTTTPTTPGVEPAIKAGGEVIFGLRGVGTTELVTETRTDSATPGQLTSINSEIVTWQGGLNVASEGTASGSGAFTAGGRLRERVTILAPGSRQMSTEAMVEQDGEIKELVDLDSKFIFGSGVQQDVAARTFEDDGTIDTLSIIDQYEYDVPLLPAPRPDSQKQTHINVTDAGEAVIDESTVIGGDGFYQDTTVSSTRTVINEDQSVSKITETKTEGAFNITDRVIRKDVSAKSDGSIHTETTTTTDSPGYNKEVTVKQIAHDDGRIENSETIVVNGILVNDVITVDTLTAAPGGIVESKNVVVNHNILDTETVATNLSSKPGGTVESEVTKIDEGLFTTDSSNVKTVANEDGVTISESALDDQLWGKTVGTDSEIAFDGERVVVDGFVIDIPADSDRVILDDGTEFIAAPNGGLQVNRPGDDPFEVATTSTGSSIIVDESGRVSTNVDDGTAEIALEDANSTALLKSGPDAASIATTDNVGDYSDRSSEVSWTPDDAKIVNETTLEIPINLYVNGSETTKEEIVTNEDGVTISEESDNTIKGDVVSKTELNVAPDGNITFTKDESADRIIHADTVKDLDVNISPDGEISGTYEVAKDSLLTAPKVAIDVEFGSVYRTPSPSVPDESSEMVPPIIAGGLDLEDENFSTVIDPEDDEVDVPKPFEPLNPMFQDENDSLSGRRPICKLPNADANYAPDLDGLGWENGELCTAVEEVEEPQDHHSGNDLIVEDSPVDHDSAEVESVCVDEGDGDNWGVNLTDNSGCFIDPWLSKDAA